MIERPFESRRCTRTLRLPKYELPASRSCSSTPAEPLKTPLPYPTGYCGYRDRSCATEIVVAVLRLEVLGNRPRNGFGVVALIVAFTALSRTGSVLRYCRGIPFNCVTVIGRCTEWLPM